MDAEAIKNKIFEILEKAKGKKKLKEKDIIKMASEELKAEKEDVKKVLRDLIEEGKLCYSYSGGASSVEIPSEEYLKEKGVL
ncbi:MAG: hypothetical protein N3A59_06485 [Thermodesulfovibrionales bacterium]|nr:hypothetical protein [Thermodesulfovibrionales bacterium]